MNKSDTKQHWEKVFTDKDHRSVSWFQERPVTSLSIIQNLSDNSASVIDVGGGASSLVYDLVKLGYTKLGMLDISGRAIEIAKQRLGDQAKMVEWFEADVTQFTPPHPYDIWHDRAVFHFLTEPQSRAAYKTILKKCIPSGGHAIIATFAKDGPKKCSGLDIMQHDDQSIRDEFDDEFLLLTSQLETHVTPGGNEQRFIYFTLQRK